MTVSYWDARESPSDADITDVSRVWLRYAKSRDEDDSWAINAILHADQRERGDIFWRLVLSLCDAVQAEDADLVSQIGAGPLEWFIDRWGNEGMDLIEPVATSNPVLRAALGSVVSHDDRVRPRIERFLQTPPKTAA